MRSGNLDVNAIEYSINDLTGSSGLGTSALNASKAERVAVVLVVLRCVLMTN